MAGKILTIEEAGKVSKQERVKGKKIILVGGCFDILHKGHVLFLEKASREGDVLFLLLESDENIKKRKGENRPINSATKRASILSALPYVHYIIQLRGVTKNEEYDKLIVQIKPDIIAITKGNGQIKKRKEQCRMVGAKLKIVIDRIATPSTTDLIEFIK